MTIKKALLRGLLGFPIGVFISTTIALIISICYGSYGSVAPDFATKMGSELNANIAQYLLSGAIGFWFSAGSAIFQIDTWNYTKQTLTHFIISTIIYFPIAIALGWFPCNVVSILIDLLIWTALYAVIWLAQYHFWKKRAAEINEKIKINK